MSMTVKELAKRYPTASEYISQIYLIIRDYGDCNNRRLAQFIGVSPSAVSQAVSRLRKLGLTSQDLYGMITLSEEGIVLAEQILKRHYLLELLMVKELKYPWDLADKEAESLQDKISDQFLEHLFVMLGRPKTCPHGNPIPGSDTSDHILAAKKFNESSEGDEISIVRITEEGEREPGLLHFCYENHMMPASIFTIKTITGESLEVENATGAIITLPKSFAEHIRVCREYTTTKV